MTLTTLVSLVICAVLVSCSASRESARDASAPAPAPTHAMGFYSLDATDIDGKPQELSQYSGQVALVVNVASECGYTPQYAGLQELYTELAPRGFVVLGFPSNDFGGQEPGSAAEIKTFCTQNYHVTFPMFGKVVTKADAQQSPVYGHLVNTTGKLPSWNFCKYLVGRDGKVIAFYPSKVAPNDAELRQAIETALAANS